MRVSIHPAAAQDIADAASFYEREGSPALAARFVAEFRKTTLLLSAQPGIGTPRSESTRGLTMNVFPYTVIYSTAENEIRVLVVKHDRKRPSFGVSRR